MLLTFFLSALASLFAKISEFVKVVLKIWSSVCPRWFRTFQIFAVLYSGRWRVLLTQEFGVPWHITWNKISWCLYLLILSLKLIIGRFPSVSFFSSGGSNSLRPVLTGPNMAYPGSRVAFRCIAPNSSLPVTYELMRDVGVWIATAPDLQGDQPAPFFLTVTATSEGSYHCKAMAGGSTGVSNSIKLSVVSE